MKPGVFCLVFFILLFAATIYGQQPTSEISGDLCREKKQSLEDFEAEAPKIRAQIAAKEKFVNKLAESGVAGNNLPQSRLDSMMQTAVSRVESDKKLVQEAKTENERKHWQSRLDEDRNWMDFWTEYLTYRNINNGKAGFQSSWQKKTQKELDTLKERQTFVANQIYILRDQIPPDGCIDNKLAGNWTGTSGSGGLREEWYIRNNNGQWTVTGKWFRGNAEVGSFSGTNYNYKDGHLSFTQVLEKAPIEGWTSGTKLEVWATGDTMTFIWTTPSGVSGTVTQHRKPE